MALLHCRLSRVWRWDIRNISSVNSTKACVWSTCSSIDHNIGRYYLDHIVYLCIINIFRVIKKWLIIWQLLNPILLLNIDFLVLYLLLLLILVGKHWPQNLRHVAPTTFLIICPHRGFVKRQNKVRGKIIIWFFIKDLIDPKNKTLLVIEVLL